METRDLAIAPAEAKGDRIEGYAAVFYDGTRDTEFELQPGLFERIEPGAFDRMFEDSDDVVARYNHNKDHILGRTSSGTLTLTVDDRGLKYSLDAPDTQIGRDVMVMLRRGDLRGSSFAFVDPADQFQRDGDRDVRSISGFGRIIDVGPVAQPAYAGSTAFARSESFDRYRDFCDKWKRENDKLQAEIAAIDAYLY